MKNSVKWLVLVSAMAICLGSQTPVAALRPAKDDTIGVRKWLIIPVFYATNRVASPNGTSIEYEEAENEGGLTFGVKNVAIPAPDPELFPTDKIATKSWYEVERPESEAGKTPPVDPEKTTLKDRRMSEAECLRDLRSYTTSIGAKNCVLFAHGCCATFDTSIKRAARIAARMGTPVILYDWVSPVGFSKYLQNETRMQQSMDDFYSLMTKVEKTVTPQNLTLLGHSMGAEFIDEALVRRAVRLGNKPTTPLKAIIMASGDMDARTVLHHASIYPTNAQTAQFFVSTDDDRLNASAMAHGNFERLGAPGPLLPQLVGIKNATVIDITASEGGHEIPFPVLAALHGHGDTALGSQYTLEKSDAGYLVLKKVEKK